MTVHLSLGDLDDAFVGWLAYWAWRFDAVAVFIPGKLGRQALLLPLWRHRGRC